MNANEHANDVSQDDLPLSVVERLVTYEELKASGGCATVDGTFDSGDSEDVACVDLMHRVWPDLSPPTARVDDLHPKVLGDFRLVRELGRGGMGTVFEAEQISMGRRVALKVLRFIAVARENSLQRFRNEVRAAAALDHPNIVSVYSIGEERGVHFYAMQLIRGRTLADLIGELRRETRLDGAVGLAGSTHPTAGVEVASSTATVREQSLVSTAVDSRRDAESYRAAARLGIQAAEALQHAHDQGVLHRDIKPSNLMLDREGKLYVTDFGLARIEADAGLTMTGDILGTLRYMAPEQALAKRAVIDHRADIYSLGATLYELLTLQPAFAETDRSDLLKQIAFEDPVSLRKLDGYISIELETIVLKAMAKSADERYETAQQLAYDLRAFLEDRPITAKRPTLVNRVRRWGRRHRAVATVATIAGGLLLMLCTGILADRRRQLRESNYSIEISIRAARTAFEAKDVENAVLRLSEAKSRIEADPRVSSRLVEKVALLSDEGDRFTKFAVLLDKARLHMTGQDSGIAPADEALRLYDVTANRKWLETLREANLPEAHINRIAEGAYTLLLLKADHLLRWLYTLPKTQWQSHGREAETCLAKAITFHKPSRGYYWLMANCSLIAKDKARETELRNIAMETQPQDATELFYVNRDHWWGTVSHHRGYPKYPFEKSYQDHREMLRLDPSYYNGFYFMALRMEEEGRNREALVARIACTSLRPGSVDAVLQRGQAYRRLGYNDEARADYETVLAMCGENPIFIGVVANYLATDLDPGSRNGKRAVELAQKACALSKYEVPQLLNTLAAAYAEVGDFDSAIKWSEKAINLTTDANGRRQLEAHLECFRQKKPSRDE